MAAFQKTREQAEQRVMVHLLSEIERSPSFTQRGLAKSLGIALGLMNQYLKSCVAKGWLRASQVSPKRITYFITPEGFREKSHMVTDYLSRSLTFFRDARTQCEEVFLVCQTNGWDHVALVGQGDLADIAKLVAQGVFLKADVVKLQDNKIKDYDGFIITDVIAPQNTYDALKDKVPPSKILTLELLHISRGGS